MPGAVNRPLTVLTESLIAVQDVRFIPDRCASLQVWVRAFCASARLLSILILDL